MSTFFSTPSYKSKCTTNKLSTDHFRTYFDYREDVPDERLAENDSPGTSFTVQYLEPFEPVEDLAEQWTMILMHGLNCSAESMQPFLDEWQTRFPGMRFVLPSAPSIPITMNMHMEMPAWHDVFELNSDGLPPQGWPGMAHSVTRVRKLLRAELARGVPSEKIILAGFSQGAHLAFALAFNTPVRIAAVLSFSGFYSNPHKTNAALEVRASVNRDMPVWLGHGTGDTVVKYAAAAGTYEVLSAEGVPVHHHKYLDMEHLFTPAVLRDASDFLQALQDGLLRRRHVLVTHAPVATTRGKVSDGTSGSRA